MKLILSEHGRMFAVRPQARDLVDAETGATAGASIVVDATDVYMSPSFIAELLVTLVEKRGYERVSVRGAREHPAKVARHLADAFGFGDRVEVEQPAVPAS